MKPLRITGLSLEDIEQHLDELAVLKLNQNLERGANRLLTSAEQSTATAYLVKTFGQKSRERSKE